MTIIDNFDSTNDTSFDSNYWQNLDTTEKFYYESFMTGDAYVNSTHNIVGIDLAIKDSAWLNNYKKNLHINTKIRIRDLRDNSNSNTIALCLQKRDKTWVKDLGKYGLVPRKTGKEVLPLDWCTNEAEVAATLLGIFDADGSIYQDSKYQNTHVSFYGNQHLCTQVNDIIDEYTNIETNKVTCSNKNHSLYQVSYSKKADLCELYKLMYQNKELCDCWLSRKHDKFASFMLDQVVV